MNAHCVICSDVFDESTSVSDIPCGHVYHTNCLSLWIDRSKTCPQCRSSVRINTIRKLFFNFSAKSDTSSSDSEKDVVNLVAQLSAKDVELATCKEERDDTIAYMIDAEERVKYLEHELKKLQRENAELRLKAEFNSKFESEVLNYDEINGACGNTYDYFRTSGTITVTSQNLSPHSHRFFEARTP